MTLAAAPTTESAETLVGESPAMRRLRDEIALVAPTDATVLIVGETGTGKGHVARALHAKSRRAGGPFVAVGLAALPRESADRMVFGDALADAAGGTLFLDDLGAADRWLQPKLLRFLDDRASLPIDVRIVAATNRDPAEQVLRGELREDLYHRLNVVPILVPPLRSRREDIPALTTLLLADAVRRHGRPVEGFTDAAIERLVRHDWPGNVRQLANLIERLAILSSSRLLDVGDLPAEFVLLPPVTAIEAPTAELRPIDSIEKQAILAALRRQSGNVAEAAKSLGLGVATVYRKIKRYGIRMSRSRRDADEKKE